MTTFFEGEIISKKYPFLTRKWEADEEVDKKHWVCMYNVTRVCYWGLWCTYLLPCQLQLSCILLFHTVLDENTP